jgi:predicted O-linked N-acetylglucosamine transferase (SPINDLY family)
MDYLIADAVAVPPSMHAHIDEAVAQLPASFMPRDTLLRIPPAPTRAAAGLPERGFVFCCFNNAYKLNPPVFDIWMRLLWQVPGSVLWLSPPGTEARENLLREARSRGVAADRIVFADKTPGIEAHLARSSLADLFLDTLPYNAHTTASDALWAGVPLLTCAGEAMASRVAASLVHAAGLPELITGDLAQYEALALRLARDPGALARMRAHLEHARAQGSLFEVQRLRRHLEAAYLHMHERSQRGLAPEGFAVPG